MSGRATSFGPKYNPGASMGTHIQFNTRTRFKQYENIVDTKTYTPTPVRNIVENKQVAVIPRVV